VHSDEFANMVRWKSLMGIECRNAILNYVAKKIGDKEKEVTEKFVSTHSLMMDDPEWEEKVRINLDDFYAIIDFSDFSFNFQNRSWTIKEFVYSFKTSRIGGQVDLIGIDLSGIRLSNCRLINICFGHAILDNAVIWQVDLINTDFIGASFCNARLSNIHVKKGSYFNNANMTGAGVYGIHPLGDKCLSQPFIYSQVSYLFLVKQALIRFFRIGNQTSISQQLANHTGFANNPTNEMTLPETRALKEYILWYQHTMQRIDHLPSSPLRERFAFLFVVLSTKHWSSYSALGLFALIANTLFTLSYICFNNSFHGLDEGFMNVFYNSTLILTSIGLEGIKPVNLLGQFIIICEVVFGYITLALFVFLLARKIERKY
jgi:uncharacterized protein YjbI with pentapeptide repeats